MNKIVLVFAVCIFNTTLSATAKTEAPNASPFAFSWPRETSLLVTGLASQLIGQYRVQTMDPAGPADLRRGDLSPLDRWNAGSWNPTADVASDVLSYAIGPAMVYADLWHLGLGRRNGHGDASWGPVLEDFLILAQAASWNAAVNLNVRALRVHPRPFVYGTAAPESERKEAQAAGGFYSGHASGAFLGAVYLASVYPLRHPEFEHKGLLWAGSLTTATGVAALRVAAGKHFPSDVIAGAAMGSLIGFGFIQLHLKDGATLWGWRATPWITTDGAPGIAATKRL